MSRVIVVGGGAAGMMAALCAAGNGHQVLLLEQNEKLGKKIYITGKGRCNVTNACEPEGFFENIVTNPKFLYSAFYGFDNRQLMKLLEDAGCPLKEERGGRVFPVSDHASDIIMALQRLLKKAKAEVRLHAKVKKLLLDESGKQVMGICLENGKTERAEAVVLATGGLAYPSTGSAGDGYRMAKEAGHTVRDMAPALVPFVVEEPWCGSLQGLSLRNVRLTMFDGSRKVYEGFGEMLFTHFGVSGPLVLSASSFYGKCKRKEEVVLELDLKPALSEEQLDKRLLREFEENHKKQFKNALGELFPVKLIPVMVSCSRISPEKKVHEISKEERRALLCQIKHFRIPVSGTRDFSEAIITQGGINVKEVQPSTMESKLVKGLFFAGEILDVDALTGGFNLQIAWSTGYLAGNRE